MDLEVTAIPDRLRFDTFVSRHRAQYIADDCHDLFSIERHAIVGLTQTVEKSEVVLPMVDLETVISQGIGDALLQGDDPLLEGGSFGKSQLLDSEAQLQSSC